VKETEVDVTALAAGGDGVARDADGRVTFVPLTAPGDRVRVKLVKETKSFARGELVAIVTASPARVEPACEAFLRGCGGCQWLHVSRAGQLEAKQALVAGALRKLDGLVIEPIADPAPALGWRRRARFHSANGKLGLFAHGTHDVVPLSRCPQLEPALDAALQLLASMSLPDGEVALLLGHRGDIAVGMPEWRAAESLVGRAGIVGVIAGVRRVGNPILEIEPGLHGGPWDFAQASAAGNAMLVTLARTALGKGPGALLELYAGAGNFTRAFTEDGWTVRPSDVAPPARPPANFQVGPVEHVLGSAKHCDAIVLDPPREGAAVAIAGLVARAPKVIVYVSCDPATLARDAAQLVAGGYRADRAWPIDLMPQTAHVEVVLRLVRAQA
jgi:23S rRNA (uracil1939-C5)-methyltransferase